MRWLRLRTGRVGGGVDTGPLTTQAVEDLDLEGLKEQGLDSSTVGLVVVLLELGLHRKTNIIGQYM